MKAILTAEQAKQVDVESTERFCIPSLVLMERAALSVTNVLCQEYELKKGDKVLALCGFGNNGADGMAVARQLRERGIAADVLLVGGRERTGTPQLETQREMLRSLGIPILYADELALNETFFSAYSYFIDALFGIGLSKPVREPQQELIRKLNEAAARQNARIVSVDISSGISASSGQVLGAAVKADRTVTFGYAKLGHILYPGAFYAGKLSVAPIGFAPKEKLKDTGDWVRSLEKEDLSGILPARPEDSNKGTFGRVLLAAGSAIMGGTACLAGKAAYRAGAGLVEVFTHEANRTALLSRVPEAIVTSYATAGVSAATLADAPAGTFGTASPSAVGAVPASPSVQDVRSFFKQSFQKAAVLAIGPGLSTDETAAELVREALTFERPLIIDADALNLLAVQGENGREMLRARRALTILTPHMGEMRRLTGQSIAELKADPLRAARQYAKATGTIVVLKDARTVVTDGQETYLNTSGNAGMAVGGAGDVLTGVLAGLLAQMAKEPRISAIELAAAAVYVHGAAGDAAASLYGERSMTAADIVACLADVLK